MGQSGLDPTTNPMACITLLTDFGTCDTFAGQMKGVIGQIAPQRQVVDLTHAIEPQNIVQGAVRLDDAVDAFAPGTIHVAVVDPGVGGLRRGIALQTEAQTFVGPDNGIFTAVLARHPMQRAVELNNPRYHRRPVAATFHGRDVFAPVAAHLAAGVALERLGEPVEDLVAIQIPSPTVDGRGVAGQVLYVDHFGNLVTNIKSALIPDGARVTVGPACLPSIDRTYRDVEPGEPVAYVGSCGRLEIAVREGRAIDRFGCDVPIAVQS
jgi:S-adenosylmethionine hydrolase